MTMEESEIERRLLELGFEKGTVAWSVRRLLSKPLVIRHPIYPKEFKTGYEVGTYTIEKIAWWFLKNNEDPANVGAMHPELHDGDSEEIGSIDNMDTNGDNDEDYSTLRSYRSSDDEDESPVTKKSNINRSPGFELEYCGLAGLEAKIRFPGNIFDTVMKIEPGTNYEMPTFKAQCRICDDAPLHGREAYANHLQSERHKHNFREFSIRLAPYQELLMKGRPMKFTAKAMAYLPKPTPKVGPHGRET